LVLLFRWAAGRQPASSSSERCSALVWVWSLRCGLGGGCGGAGCGWLVSALSLRRDSAPFRSLKKTDREKPRILMANEEKAKQSQKERVTLKSVTGRPSDLGPTQPKQFVRNQAARGISTASARN